MAWASRLGNLGRFSPFTRSPPQGPTKVSDADFSYITADDLRKHQAESGQQQQQQQQQHHHPSHHHAETAEASEDRGPLRDTDVLILENKRKEFTVHFAAYSIANGELTVGQVREHAAKKTGTGDARRIKLLHRGKNLKDDRRTCKSEGLRDGSKLMCTIAESMPSDDEDDDDGDDNDNGDEDERADLDGEQPVDADPRRRRNRGKRTKRRNKRLDQPAQTSGTSTPQDSNLGVPLSQSTTRVPSPKPPSSPATPMDKLSALHSTLRTFLPDCEDFTFSPPSDPAKRVFEHKRLSESILTHVLLQLDAVETEGDADARARRKELVKETQAVLNSLDAAVKKSSSA